MKEFVVKEKDTLKNFTDNTYPQGSFYFSRLLKERDIKVNGARVNGDCPLKKGDVVSYYTTPAQESRSAFERIYEDGNILICDKESGVNSEAVFASLRQTGEYYFIHRLDRNTQGLIAFARTREAESRLLAAFRCKNVEKKYRALCFGTFEKESDTLCAYLQKDERNALVKISLKQGQGEKIVTEYRVLERRGEFTKTEITLHTGKTHQIRAHMAFIGCPVAGDEKYGDRERNDRYHLKRQCLISYSLKFTLEGALSYLNGETFLSRKQLPIG